jgi:hypothetical protein
MPPLAETRVGKTLQPGQGGTIKLQRRFGESLLQVRYRYDWTGLFRYTTVELLVDVSPVTRAASLDTLFTLRLSPAESTLLQEAHRHGAEWHEDLLCWILPGRAIQALDLAHRAESTTQRHRLRRKHRMPRK